MHIETNPADKKYLKELIQFVKERNLLSLFLGKQVRISEVMDNNSTPGEVKRMVECAMGHVNYQGSMTGESISGIFLLNGDVQFNKGKVSLCMVLFTYFKMADKFSVFA